MIPKINGSWSLLLALIGCLPDQESSLAPRESAKPGDVQVSRAAATDDPAQATRRARMVDQQLRSRDITDPRVLEVMGQVPRHRFVPEELVDRAYEDGPLPIGSDQTISQPYIVALMTQLARPKPTDRALDIGTGSGYQAAVLSGLVREVYGIEILPELAESARERLQRLGYRNVTVRAGDGYRGWPEQAPFDLILLAAAAPEVPPPLLDQLAVGGRLVLPVDVPHGLQELVVITRKPDGGFERRTVIPVAFVPMTGDVRKRPKPTPDP
jgi:protein-L-isoaspartate(D-aspartate) O-methyltransferase